MEKFSIILTNHLVKKNVVVAEKSSIYQYGFQIGLEVCFNTIISIFIALQCQMVWETLVFFGVFILLRSYAGGLHLKTYIRCLVCSCASLWGLLLSVKYLDIHNLLSLGIVGVSLLSIKLLSPVQDINRPLSTEELNRFGKRLNYSIASIVGVSLVFYLMQLNKLLLMVSVTTAFMVGVLILGKIKYKKQIKESKL